MYMHATVRTWAEKLKERPLFVDYQDHLLTGLHAVPGNFSDFYRRYCLLVHTDTNSTTGIGFFDVILIIVKGRPQKHHL
jgi:hypothetical protein